MKLLPLLCLLGVVLSAPTDSDSSDAVHYDTIVVGMGSAGTTAATELARAGKRVLALEAQSRIGGRVYTMPLEQGLVEVGAEWIHGTENSRTYNLATKYNITLLPQASTMESYRSDGSTSYSNLISEFYEFSQDVLEEPPETPEAQGTYVTRKLMDYIKQNKPELLKDQDFITEVLEFLNLMTNNLEASNDWNDATTGGNYQVLEGNQAMSWHRNGYKTFFEIMLVYFTNNDSTVSCLEEPKLGKFGSVQQAAAWAAFCDHICGSSNEWFPPYFEKKKTASMFCRDLDSPNDILAKPTEHERGNADQ